MSSAIINHKAASCHYHNSVRKAARKVEAIDDRAKLSFGDNQIGLPPW
ncbi:MAG: hypothetical protein QGF31_02725 [Nitrospinota bacterium]|nr:hypothetical protein [Nitrospinota bacterium]